MTTDRPRKYPTFEISNERNESTTSRINGSALILPYFPAKSPY